MRLALRLTLGLVIGSTVLLSLQAILQARRLLEVHEKDLRDDLQQLSDVLVGAVSTLWQDAGEARARAYLKRVDQRRAHIRIRLTPMAGGLSQASPLLEVRGDRLVLRSVVATPSGQPSAVLELSRTLGTRGAPMQRIVVEQFLVAAGVVLAVGVLALLVGVRVVGWRVQRLIQQAREVGAGHYDRNDEQGRDELGALADELNHMVGTLQQAEQLAQEEGRARSQALEQLRHADRLSTVGRLASVVAHELGTPLNVVAGRAQMIVDGAGKGTVNNAEIIVKQAQQMTSTIQQLLSYARKPSQTGDDVDVDDVLQQAVALMEPLADDQEVRIDVTLTEGLRAKAQASKVLQILTNLVVNGIHAMPNGGTLALSAREEYAESPPDRRAAPGHYIRFDVRDQGVGIDKAALDHVFEPFFTTKSTQEGTGLGLSVCHDIVREHGGWIVVDSEPDHGSCFSVFLPVGEGT